VGTWDGESARRAASGARACGYDRLEIPLLDHWDIDTAETRRALDDNGLAMTGNLFLTDETDITSPDSEAVRAGEQRLRHGVDVVSNLGGDYLCGTIYSKLGRYTGPATPQGRAQCVQVLQRVADHAADKGIRLGIEICNRYETNLVNTAAQAVDLIKDIGRTNVCVHLDTYHMCIEEPDMVSPVLTSGELLGYVHIGENHRGYPGSGRTDFAAFFRALAHVGYTGPITFESFSSAVVEPELSNALCIWRNLWVDSEDLARHAHAFIETQLRATEAATGNGSPRVAETVTASSIRRSP
jgi:D-psicose/D-tagatose/L-ribulose 3-epimerase